MAKALTEYEIKLAEEGHCMADDDGDCTWIGCPQMPDGEPAKTGRVCPRHIATLRRLDPDGEGKAGNG